MVRRRKIRVAILDLYEGQPNQGMRCLRELLRQWSDTRELDIHVDEFEVRLEGQIPDLSYDVYISSGGPGDPLENGKIEWEAGYFRWLREVEEYNRAPASSPKHILFICHSFQLACRYFTLARITRRRSTAFGVFPVHLQQDGRDEPLFNGLTDPFFAVDSRDYQVTSPDELRLRQLGAHVLAIEKERPHVPLERAVMAVRFNPCMIGTQFHPEADATGMSMYLQREDKKKTVIAEHGEEKWRSMIDHLNDPDKILSTYSHVIPNFLDNALRPGGRPLAKTT
jgi:homoserine O-succinyltransferase/O-acetyltransferase